MPYDRRDYSITFTCIVCGTPYHPRRDRATTSHVCSQACARRLGVSTMNGVAVDTVNAVPEKGMSRECPHCHQTFRVVHTGQRFCSRRCANRYGRSTLPELEPRTCQQCQRTYTPLKPSQRYCSRTCVRQAQEQSKLERLEGAQRECPRCHRLFIPKRKETRYCSRRCAWEQDESQAVARTPQECPWCHQTFIPRQRGQRYCSALCQRGASISRIRESARNSHAANEKRRQAQLQRVAEGRHFFLKIKPAEGDTPLAPPAPPAPPSPAPLLVSASAASIPSTPTLPPLLPLPDDAEGVLDEINAAEERGESSPLTFPLQGAQARSEWQDIGDLRESQAEKLLRREEVRTPEGRTVILAGQGSYLGMEGGALIMHQGRTHGTPAPERELLYPAVHNVRRIIWIGAHGHLTGTLTLAAAAWCQREGIHLCVLDGAGMPLLEMTPANYPHDAQLRRQQWLVSSGIAAPPVGVLAYELVRRKVEGQHRTLTIHPELPGQAQCLILFEEWRQWLTMKHSPDWLHSIAQLRRLEGRLAFAYFRAWEGWPLNWSKPDTRRIPPHWLAARSRISPLAPQSNARRAVDPVNACLNYCYACLASQCRQTLLAEGFDLTGGFLHADKPGRDSLTYDLMELERGAVDDLLLTFLGKTTLHYGDFARSSDGQIMLHPQLTRLLLAECRVRQSRIDEHARWLKRFLLSGAQTSRSDDAPAE